MGSKRGLVKGTYNDAHEFFIELLALRSPLLSFRDRGGDRWQAVHGWLRKARRVD